MKKPDLGVANDRLFRLFVESVRDYALFLLDPRGVVATWNAGAERIKGYRADEIIGLHFSTFYPPEDVAAGKCEMELETATREGRFEELGWRVRKDGTRFWANVVISPVRDADGTLIGFSKVTRDLTERKLAEEAQTARFAAEERFRLLVASVEDYAIFMLDPNGQVATWNAGAARIKGYRADEIIGRHFSTFYPPEDVAAGKCERELEGATRDGRFEDEGWRVRKDGTRFWANVVIGAVRDERGTLLGFSKITRDLTDRREREEEQAARLVAERENRVKDEFLAMLGHELRNPLAPISTALQLLKLRGEARDREHEIIERHVNHMLRLVDDLLDISRVSRGVVELRKATLDVRGAVGKAIEHASALLEQKGQHLTTTLPLVPVHVVGDEARLVQIFGNLLNNAAKYTPANGHIALEMGVEEGWVTVAVRDDGVGLSAALLPRVFDLFVQGYQGVERQAGGIGLGLALVRRLVDLHGGVVSAASPGLERGSTFTVRLPRAALGAVALLAAPPEVLPAVVTERHILLVDDNVDACDLLADVLRAVGYAVTAVYDPAAALAAVAVTRPDLAILDIGLPVMDGYELAERLRAVLGPGAPSMIALTGYGQDSDHARSAEAGFARHFIKPVDVKRLLAALAELLADTVA